MGRARRSLAADTLILEDVRCFAGRHEIPVRPLTLLVGENSSGKSTFLAMLRAAGRLDPVNFNEPPFDLGAYEQIARVEKKGGNVRQFRVGVALGGRRYGAMPEGLRGLEVTFGERHGQPFPRFVEVAWDDGQAFRADIQEEEATLSWPSAAGATGKLRVPFPSSSHPGLALVRAVFSVLDRLKEQPSLWGDDEAHRRILEETPGILLFTQGGVTAPPHAYAPIRSQPKRTYDPRSDAQTPDGAHVPMVLARLSMVNDNAWDELQKRVVAFGAGAGLLSALDVARKGEKASDPFQVSVQVGGMQANLVDVGYGVSQVLPVLVDIALADRGSTLLLQQPEVHLHPRAQAQLGTYFVRAVELGVNLVVETHSDQILDRVRMEVRDAARGKKKKGIQPEQVLILYFERTDEGVKVHPITIGKDGGLAGVPEGYRDFFLREEARFLGVDDVSDR